MLDRREIHSQVVKPVVFGAAHMTRRGFVLALSVFPTACTILRPPTEEDRDKHSVCFDIRDPVQREIQRKSSDFVKAKAEFGLPVNAGDIVSEIKLIMEGYKFAANINYELDIIEIRSASNVDIDAYSAEVWDKSTDEQRALLRKMQNGVFDYVVLTKYRCSALGEFGAIQFTNLFPFKETEVGDAQR